nr:hypothetical protein [uncultured Limnohabitans sp.]
MQRDLARFQCQRLARLNKVVGAVIGHRHPQTTTDHMQLRVQFGPQGLTFAG